MKQYQHVVVALELNDEGEQTVVKKAKELATQFGAQLSLVHAVEQLSHYGAAYGVSVGVDVEAELQNQAEESMTKIGDVLGVAKENQVVRVGPAKYIILEEAERVNADLIIVGSHGRHGVQLLLGSTANAVLHGAKCDVLAVRVSEDS